MQAGNKRPSPAMIIAVIALIASLSGTAFAALGKNTVGSRQLKKKAVTTGKIANNAVTSVKVAPNSLTAADINLSQLGTVPSAQSAASAGDSNTVSGHAATCPPATTLIRGVCFDSTSNPPTSSLKAAADACAARGGYLPTPMALFSVRSVINLGTGVGTDRQYTDSYFGSTGGGDFRTIVVDGAGNLATVEPVEDAEYICAYPLVR